MFIVEHRIFNVSLNKRILFDPSISHVKPTVDSLTSRYSKGHTMCVLIPDDHGKYQ